MKKLILKAALLATMATLTGAAQAALIDRGGGLIYDDTFNITWLADMNYAKTSGYDADGQLTWDDAVSWADTLVYGGYSDWRLPTLNPSDTSCEVNGPGFGNNCTGGELSHLFVTDLGYNVGLLPVPAVGPEGPYVYYGYFVIASDDTAEQKANLALFSNVQSYLYWSGLSWAENENYAFTFGTITGQQNADTKVGNYFAVAVRDGNVSPVPEPETYALMLAGLAVVGAAAKRKSSRAQ